ncbi:uncharacterized protein MKZ38_001375 [Zalerion maritima]|uniref:FAD dependent oxidoreductase domain-containing protein n=1 Tax=Zalerion maritima TaxID=339359 RepID=A0AAD5RRT2_9PEZI|nr:uncharacterized protein MKZ38_001375 [Zalerion maritima]
MDSTRSGHDEKFLPPSFVLIIGPGVFGLSTARSMARNPTFSSASITLVGRSPDAGGFRFPDAASVDKSRIIRPDYKDLLYARLAAQAQVHWRSRSSPSTLGSEGRYHETGLVLVADTESPNIKYVRESFDNATSLAAAAGNPSTVRELTNGDAIRKRTGTGGSSGSWGYVNETSGWADAAASMKWLFTKVRGETRVKPVWGTVSSLVTTGDRVTCAVLSDGREFDADLVVVAASA